MKALHLDQLPRGYEIALDPVTVASIVGLTLLVGVVLGLAPIAKLRRMNLNVELREEGRGGTAGRRANLIRSGLAMAQVAIALVVLAGAGLLFASFRAVMRADLGFRPARVATVTVSLPGTTYKDGPALVGFEQRALDAVRALPQVEAAGGTTLVPFSGNVTNSVILAEGHVMKPGESLLAPSFGTVTAGYFESMGVVLQGGRFFDRRDTRDSPKVVVIDDRLANVFWPGRDAVGRRLYFPDDRSDLTKITPKTVFLTVVGVIREMQMLDPRGDITPVGTVYFPYEQNTSNTFTLTIRTRTDVGVTNSVRHALATIDPQVPVYRPRTMTEWIDQALVGRRVPMLIAIAFAVVALFLCAVGVYGVLAYGVAQRRRELGVRLALGGTSGRIFGLVLARGLRIVAAGVLVGLVGTFFVGQLMRSQLVNITPTNPVVLLLRHAHTGGHRDDREPRARLAGVPHRSHRRAQPLVAPPDRGLERLADVGVCESETRLERAARQHPLAVHEEHVRHLAEEQAERQTGHAKPVRSARAPGRARARIRRSSRAAAPWHSPRPKAEAVRAPTRRARSSRHGESRKRTGAPTRPVHRRTSETACANCVRTPPSPASTIPERRITTRQPSASAARASASHSTHRVARKSEPGGQDSSTSDVPSRAVVVDAGRGDEQSRPVRGKPYRRDEAARAQDSAVVENGLAPGRPAARADAFARQIDDDVRAVDLASPRRAAGAGRPVRVPGDAASIPQPRGIAGQDHDVVPSFRQGAPERLPEKSGAAGKQDLHEGPRCG